MAEQRAVVFAYSDIGVRGLSALLANDLEIALVVTHEDAASENIWFDSVAGLARRNGIPAITPRNPNAPDVVERVRACAPDWIFSFYYRHMLGAELLGIPRRGALNLHGSLLPLYRGRAPVNWAVLHGETQTGASLHRMVAKPDAGDLVDQQAVPILPNDTAKVVHERVACAAEMVLMRAVPGLLAGTAAERPLDLARGSYFGGRTPEDGRIDWTRGAQAIHNLVRAVAPPWPGAFFDVNVKGTMRRLHVMGSYYRGEPASAGCTRLYAEAERLWADCADGRRFEVLALRCDGEPLAANAFVASFGPELLLTDSGRKE